MARFDRGDRVILRGGDYLGIPSGSIGTVDHGGPASARVMFDRDPSRFLQVPNPRLALARAAREAFRALSFSVDGGGADRISEEELQWFPPIIRQPQVGTAANFVAVTETANTLSLLFEEARVALRHGAQSGAWVGALEFTVEGSRPVRGQLRAFVEQPKDGRATIVAVIGGTTHRFEYDGDSPGNLTLPVDAKVASGVVTIAVLLVAERQSTNSDSIVEVDGLDLVG